MTQQQLVPYLNRKVRVTLLDGSTRDGELVSADAGPRFRIRDAEFGRDIRYDVVTSVAPLN